MARIFISYRREDSDIWVSRLVDELRKHFPPEQVFQDIASIDPGADFVEALEKGLSTAAVMLAVIGQRWLSATDKQGRRRLDMPGDFVRQEIAESLRRPGVGVFPLLVNGAEMPAEEELPEPLKALHRRQAFELTVRHWHEDVAQLVQTLKLAPGFSDDRRADEFTRPGAEQAAQRRGAEERAAKEEAERIAAEDRAKKKAEEDARRQAAEEEAQRKAAEEARRKAEEEDRRKVEEEARRKATIAPPEEVATPKARETEEPAITEQPRTEHPKSPETAADMATATGGTSSDEAGVPPSKFGWKAVAAIGAIVGAVALLAFFSGGERHEPRPASPTAPPMATAQPEKPSAASHPSETAPRASKEEAPAYPPPAAPAPAPTVEPAAKSTPPDARRIVINRPKPLYAPYKTGDVVQECTGCPEMVVIIPDPNGFTIGTPESQAKWGREAHEKPFGPIRFAKPYAIGKFEITRAQFKSSGVQPAAGCHVWDGTQWQPDSKRSWERPGFEQSADHPVVCVSWNDVQEYLRWLNRQAGSSAKDAYRLPSEAEWEYAARAGTTSVRYWGNEPERACDYANVADRTAKAIRDTPIHECSDGFLVTAPVGQFIANEFKLKDMIGNVFEWVEDCYAEQYSKGIRDGSAFETANCGLRVARGGCWDFGPETALAASRWKLEPGIRLYYLGFRVARTL